MKRPILILLIILCVWPVDGAGDTKPSKSTLNKWLHHAAFSGDVQLAIKALDLGADVNETLLGLTPLYNASTFDHLSVVKELIRQGAKINIPSGPAR